MISPVAVSIVTELLTGAVFANGSVRLTPTALDVEGAGSAGAILVPSAYNIALDASGLATQNVLPNVSTQYLVEFFDAKGNPIEMPAPIYATIPGAPIVACYLHDHLTTAAPVLSDAQRALAGAQAAQAAAQAVLTDPNFVAVRSDLPNIDAVAAALTQVVAVYNNLTALIAVANDLTALNAIYNALTALNGIYGALTALNALYTDLNALNALNADLANLNALALDLANIDIVAGDKANVDAVAAIAAAINTNAANIVAIQSAAANASTAASQAQVATAQAAQSLASAMAAAAQAQLAQGYAAQANSVVQQDLSGVTAAALHRSPNAIVAMAIDETWKHNDGGAWIERVADKGWANEVLNGNWLPATSPDGYQSELDARCYKATLGAEVDADPTFATSVGWTLASGASIASNTLTAASVATGAGIATRADAVGGAMALATAYQVTVVVATLTAGAILVRLGNTTTNLRTLASPGTYTFTVNPGAAGANLGLYASGTTSGTVTKFSIKPVTAQNTLTNDFFQLATDGKFYSLNAGAGKTETFTGNSQKYPRLPVAVAEAASLSCFAADLPGRPLWRRFPTSGALQVGNITAATAVNGLIWVTGSAGVALIDFPNDRIIVRSSAAVKVQYGISARTTNALQAMGGNTTTIVNSAANCVSAYVQPDAPLDPATGLQVPTVAIGTAGGSTLLQNNGAAVNSASTAAVTDIAITPDLLTVANSASASLLYASKPGTLGASFALTTLASGAAPGLPALNWTGMKTAKRGRILRRNGARIDGLILNEANPAASMGFSIADTFNTGLWAGDIRRCFMSDTFAGTTGPSTELTTNGTWATDVSGWTTYQGSTLTWVSAGNVTGVSSGTSNVMGYQAIATVAGRTYNVVFTRSAPGRCSVYLGTTLSVNDLERAPFGGANTVNVQFTAKGATTYLAIVADSADRTTNFGAISVQECVADRSYKAQPLTINGTLARTAVATAASLMFYSGWSVANYLQQAYSADLDFGTGAWRWSDWVNIPATGFAPANFFTNSEFPNGLSDAPSRSGLVTATTFSGLTDGTGLAVGYDGATSSTVYKGNFTPIAGASYYISTYVRMDDGLAPSFTNSIGSDVGNDFALVVGNQVADPTTYVVTNLGGGLYRVSGAVTAFSATATVNGIAKYATNSNRTFKVSGFQVERGALRPYVRTTTAAYNGIACAFDRSAATGPYIRGGIDGNACLALEAYDGATTRRATSAAAYNTATNLKASFEYTTDGTLRVGVNEVSQGTAFGAPLLTLNNASAVLTVGNARTLDAAFPGSIALLKAGATVPTLEQKALMFAQENEMFQPNAVCVLPDSGAVVDLAYDSMQDKLKVASATNESSFTGLVRTMSAAVSAGSFTKVAHASGVKLLGRSTTSPGVDVMIPALGLMTELFNRWQGAAALSRPEQVLTYSGGFTCTTTLNSTALTNVANWVFPSQANPRGLPVVATGVPAGAVITDVVGSTVYVSAAATVAGSGVSAVVTDLALPPGYEAKAVSKNGSRQAEGSSNQFTRAFDGFVEREHQISNPLAGDLFVVDARRMA